MKLKNSQIHPIEPFRAICCRYKRGRRDIRKAVERIKASSEGLNRLSLCVPDITQYLVTTALACQGWQIWLTKVGHKLCKTGSQNVLISDLKSPGFVPFGANLAHLLPKSDIPGFHLQMEPDLAQIRLNL